MISDSRSGRPRASSRETLAEAACELFLEQGYEATSIADIAQRAGVSRSSFFNYFASKGDMLWAGLDERLDDVRSSGSRTTRRRMPRPMSAPRRRRSVDGFAPDSLALALVNAPAMGLVDELEREASLRRSRIARAASERLRRGGADRLRADVAGAAIGGAVLAALDAWARDGAGRADLARILVRALEATSGAAARTLGRCDSCASSCRRPTSTRRSRSIATWSGCRRPRPTKPTAARAWRSSMPGARRSRSRTRRRCPSSTPWRPTAAPATASASRSRSTTRPAAVERLARAGAEVEASARQTPWRSINARLRGPADLQLTLFQELGPA